MSFLKSVIVCASLFHILGFWDDRKTLSPIFRLVSQAFLALIIWANGIQIRVVDLSFFAQDLNLVLPSLVSCLITIIWLVGVTNSINWIDGIDGLAASISAVIFLFMILIGALSSNLVVIIFSAIMLGSCLSFLKYNIYPSKIIMGDSGSNFIGITIAILSTMCFSNITYTNKAFLLSNIRLDLAILMLIYPLGDMFIVILSRVFKGLSPFKPDKRHLHHKLIELGFNQKQIVLLMAFLSFFVSILVFYLYE